VSSLIRLVRAGFVLAVAVAFGGLIAAIGCFWQSGQIFVGSTSIPIGLLAALAITWTGCTVVGSLTTTAAASFAVGAGWVLTVLTLSAQRPAGDLVVPGAWYGYAFLVGGLLIVVISIFRSGIKNL